MQRDLLGGTSREWQANIAVHTVVCHQPKCACSDPLDIAVTPLLQLHPSHTAAFVLLTSFAGPSARASRCRRRWSFDSAGSQAPGTASAASCCASSSSVSATSVASLSSASRSALLMPSSSPLHRARHRGQYLSATGLASWETEHAGLGWCRQAPLRTGLLPTVSISEDKNAVVAASAASSTEIETDQAKFNVENPQAYEERTPSSEDASGAAASSSLLLSRSMTSPPCSSGCSCGSGFAFGFGCLGCGCGFGLAADCAGCAAGFGLAADCARAVSCGLLRAGYVQ